MKSNAKSRNPLNNVYFVLSYQPYIMGTWNTAIDGNDAFLDIYSNFFSLYNQGYSPSAVSKQIMNDFEELFNDPDDRHNALFALALAHWETKYQDANIQQEVTDIINWGKNLTLWRVHEASKEQIQQRQTVLNEFLNRISKPKDKAKRRSKIKEVFESIEIVNIIAPDNQKRFVVNEHYTNGQYVQTGSMMKWNEGGRSVIYFNGQGKSISAKWRDTQTLIIMHANDIVFTKKDSSAYYCGDNVNISYVAVNV